MHWVRKNRNKIKPAVLTILLIVGLLGFMNPVLLPAWGVLIIWALLPSGYTKAVQSENEPIGMVDGMNRSERRHSRFDDETDFYKHDR